MYCIVDNFLSEMTTAASVFTLTVTSYDRCYIQCIKKMYTLIYLRI